VGLVSSAAHAQEIEERRPSFAYPGRFPRLHLKSFREAELHTFQPSGVSESVRLRHGSYRVRKPFPDQIWDLRLTTLPSAREGLQLAALSFVRIVIGGSSWCGGYVQVLGRDLPGKVTVRQQLHYGCHGVGGGKPGLRYDATQRRLTIRSSMTDSAAADPKVRCIVGTYRWDGQFFVAEKKRTIRWPAGSDSTSSTVQGCDGVD